MQFHELLGESEADACALIGSAPRAFDAMKALEDTRQFVFGNAGAGIGNGEKRMVAVSVRTTHGDGAFKGEFERVREKVEDNFLPHIAVH